MVGGVGEMDEEGGYFNSSQKGTWKGAMRLPVNLAGVLEHSYTQYEHRKEYGRLY